MFHSWEMGSHKVINKCLLISIIFLRILNVIDCWFIFLCPNAQLHWSSWLIVLDMLISPFLIIIIHLVLCFKYDFSVLFWLRWSFFCYVHSITVVFSKVLFSSSWTTITCDFLVMSLFLPKFKIQFCWT